MPTPAWPVETAEESPEHRRKYLVEREGAVSSTTVLSSYNRVSDRQQTSIDRESKVLANAACCPICFNVRTLNAAKYAEFFGLKNDKPGVLDSGQDNGRERSGRSSLELEFKEQELVTGMGMGAEKD